MVKVIFGLLCALTTPEQQEVAKAHYIVPIYSRIYVRKPVAFYLDTTYGPNSKLTAFHFEGWFCGLGYRDEVLWGTIKGQPCLFLFRQGD